MAKASGIRKLSAESPEFEASRDPFARDSIEHLVGRYGSPLFLIDAERVRTQFQRLSAALPGRRPVLRHQMPAASVRGEHAAR